MSHRNEQFVIELLLYTHNSIEIGMVEMDANTIFMYLSGQMEQQKCDVGGNVTVYLESLTLF